MRYTPSTRPLAHTAAALRGRGSPRESPRPRPGDRCAPRACRAPRRTRATNDGPQQEVFGRVPGDRELGKRDEVAPGGVGPFVGVEHAVDVAVEVADDEVELRGGESEAGHRFRIRDTACMPGGTTLRETADLTAAIERSADARDRSDAARPGRWRSTRLLADELVDGRPRARRPASRSPARRVRSRPRSSPTRPCSIRCAIADDFAHERTVDCLPLVVERQARPTTAAGSGGGSGASCCASPGRDLLGAADMPAVGRELAALRAGVPRGRARHRRTRHAVRGHRDGQARRARAELRVRHRRAVRARRRRRRRRAHARARCSPR